MAHTAKPYASVPTLFERVRDELTAIEEITRVLGSLPDHETRVRVIRWIDERFSQGFPGAPQPTDDAANAHRPVDSGLSFPDDLFEPAAVSTVETGDLHGAFDPPSRKSHQVSTETLQRQPAGRAQPGTSDKSPLLMVVKPEAVTPADRGPAVIDEPHAGAQQPAVTIDAPQDGFELVPPAEMPLPDVPADDAVDEAPPVDRRQLKLLLLADMTPPAPLAVSVPATSDSNAESPAPKTNAPVKSTRKVRTTRRRAAELPAPTAPPRVADVENAPASADAVANPPTAATPPPDDSMEALLRSLVADFRELAEEWGNT